MAQLHSKLEKIISAQGYQLAEVDLPITFYDKDNHKFTAKSDAVMVKDGKLTIIEFKGDVLNNKTCIASCKNKLLAQCNYRELNVPVEKVTHTSLSARLWLAGYHKDCLLHAWNHSRVKQKIVNDGLKKVDIDFMVVFTQHPPKVKKGRSMVYFQLFYPFPTLTFHEFKEIYKDATFLNRSAATTLINTHLSKAA